MENFWWGVGNAAKVAGVASGAKSAYDSYQALGSPNTFLRSAGEQLDKVGSRLQAVTPQRREEIEQNVASGHKSIQDLEVQLGELRDMHCRLCKWYEDANIVNRHLPFTRFRSRLVRLQENVRALLNDTWNTTVPDVDNLLFPTSSELEQVTVPTPATSGSPDISPTNSELPPGAWGDRGTS